MPLCSGDGPGVEAMVVGAHVAPAGAAADAKRSSVTVLRDVLKKMCRSEPRGAPAMHASGSARPPEIDEGNDHCVDLDL